MLLPIAKSKETVGTGIRVTFHDNEFNNFNLRCIFIDPAGVVVVTCMESEKRPLHDNVCSLANTIITI